jgi:hypothetical protein
MKKILGIVLFFGLTATIYGQTGLTCNCEYFSKYKFEKYKTNIDSIGKRLKKNYSIIAKIGSRSFGGADMLFVVKKDKQTIGFYYDLANRKSKTITGAKIDRFSRMITADSLEITKMSKIVVPTDKKIDHDMSYFISYNSPYGNVFYEICGSQMINSENKSVRQTIDYYFDNVR